MRHCNDGVKAILQCFGENCVAWARIGNVDPLSAQRFSSRVDDLDLFAPDRAIFSGMWVQARESQARRSESETGDEVGGTSGTPTPGCS